MRSAYITHDRETIDFSEEEKLTKESMAAECDINNIMKRYEKTGLHDHVNTHQGDYGDYTQVQDYQISLQQIINAKDMFQSIPASIRSRFNNSPKEFLDFVSDENNVPEMREMGLIPAERGEDPPSPDPDPAPSKTAHAKAEPTPANPEPAEPAQTNG